MSTHTYMQAYTRDTHMRSSQAGCAYVRTHVPRIGQCHAQTFVAAAAMPASSDTIEALRLDGREARGA